MKQLITSFDPTAAPMSGSFVVPLPQNRAVGGLFGNVFMANESSVSLIITVNESRFRCPPWMLIKIPLKEITSSIQWQEEVVLTNAASAPISLVLVDGWTPDEEVGTGYPIPLVRNTNVGGVVNASTVTTLINNGNAPNTLIVQTQPSDQSIPAYQLDNEGNLVLRTLSVNVWTDIMKVVAGTAVAAAVATMNLAGGNLQANAINTTGTRNNGTGNYAFSSTGPISTDNKLFATDGSGNIVTVGSILGANGISAVTIQLAGNGTFTRRGNFSGTGSGTVATGAGGTPTWLGITDNQAGSSATVGAVISGSNAVVTMGAAHTWMGIAL